MDLMNIVRIAKVVALLAFVLPWVAISCSVPGSGTVDLATASGIELIQGKMTANPNAEKQLQGGMGGMFGQQGGSLGADSGLGNAGSGSVTSDIPDLGMNFFGVAAAAVIVIGLLLSFAGKGKTASRNVLATSVLGLVLVFGTVWWWKDQIKKQGGEDGGTASASSPFGDTGGNPFGGGGAMGAQMVDNMLQERFGYWIAFSALIVAAGAGALGMAGGAAAGAAKPESEPPVV